MKTKSLTVAEAIEKVEQGFGSVYTKEDVISLLNALKVDGGSEATSMKDVIKELKNLKNKIVDKVMENMESEVIDYDSASFTIEYDNKIQIDSIDLDDYQVEMAIKTAIDDVVEELEEQMKDDENVEEDSNNQ